MSVSKSVVLSDAEFASMFDVSIKPTAVTQQQLIVNSSATTSSKIRQLRALNVSRSEVAKLLQIRYQHVRNVELQILKRAS